LLIVDSNQQSAFNNQQSAISGSDAAHRTDGGGHGHQEL
jgi:hypothetical protein